MRTAWNALVGASRDGWLFHRREFTDACVAAWDIADHSVVALDGEDMVGLLPLTLYRPAPRLLESVNMAPAGVALSPGLGRRERPEISRALIEAAVSVAANVGAQQVRVRLPCLAPAQLENRYGASPLEAMGFEGRVGSSYVLDLAPSPDDLFAGCRTLARRQIRKAERGGVRIRLGGGEKDLESYWRLHNETYHRTGASPHPQPYFRSIFREFEPAGLCRIWVAEKQGSPLAFLNTAVYKDAAFYWTGCSSDEGLAMGANYLLQWRALDALRAEGVCHYEIGEAFPGRAGDKPAGLNEFKRSFGAQRRPLHSGTLSVSESLRPNRFRLSAYYFKRCLMALLKGE